MAACKKDSINSAIEPVDNPHPTNFAIYPVPAKGYVGDMMPFYDNNTFHLFYLQDWRDNAPNYHPWFKYTTTDLLNYTYQGQMIELGSSSEQDFTLGTGSVIKAGNTYYAYYTGHNYLFLGTGQGQEAIEYATSTDLNTWSKKTNYILKAPSGYSINDFRDPFIIYNDATQEYWLIVAAQANGSGVLIYYTTKDLANPAWVYQKPFYSNPSFAMMECPDVFKIGNYWYLVFSDTNLQNATHYCMATSLGGPWTTPANDLLDGRYFYAAKTASDGKNRYLFGWVPTKSGFTDAGGKEFAGNMSSHLLTQNTDGTLAVGLPDAIQGAFTKPVAFTQTNKDADVISSGTTYQINANNTTGFALLGKVSGTYIVSGSVIFSQIPQSFGFMLGSDGTSANTFRVGFMNGNLESDKVSANNVSMDASIPFAITSGQEYTFKLVIESSIATLYINNKAALSTRIYGMQNNAWGIYATNGAVTFKNIQLLQH